MITAEWVSQIPEYLAMLSLTLQGGVNEGAEAVAQIARDNVHVDTGSLHDTIDTELVRADAYAVEMSVNAGNMDGGYRGGSMMNAKPAGAPVDYAIAQEYGLGSHNFGPFMAPASEIGWLQVQQSVTDAISRISA